MVIDCARRFIVLFQEKEGTTALMELLDNFPSVSVLETEEGSSEPFDRHNRRVESMSALIAALDSVLQPNAELSRANHAYRKLSSHSLVFRPDANLIGFKMRFEPLRQQTSGILRFFRYFRRRNARRFYEQKMFHLLQQHRPTVFVAVRRDLLRWALSKYHGDGTGKAGHLQFRLVSGELRKENIDKIHVNPDRLQQLIDKCRRWHRQKKALLHQLAGLGLNASPIFYEDFCGRPEWFFKELFHRLGVAVDAETIRHALAKGTRFQKVHDADISTFVTNHEEITKAFGNLASEWD